MKRDFKTLRDITAQEGEYLLARTAFLKQLRKERREHKPLRDKCLAMIFEKASTRTRISFEVGIRELGGYGLFMSPTETQIGRGEPIRDTARVLSRYAHGVMIRTFSQGKVDELAEWASVPVINGLSDTFHPCQILSDLFTVTEKKGDMRKIKIAYVGDGNNIANSWVEASLLFGLTLSLATPEGYEPEAWLLEEARTNPSFTYTHDPREAVRDADVVNTDVWVSMGQEEEKIKKKKSFAGYRVDDNLLEHAKKDVIVMHCLPAYREEEITDAVFERHQQVIFDQAENRLHAQKALLEWLMKDE